MPPETPQALYFAALKLQMCSLGSFGSSASPRCACPHRTTTTRRGLSCASAHSEKKTADAACGKELSSKGAVWALLGEYGTEDGQREGEAAFPWVPEAARLLRARTLGGTAPVLREASDAPRQSGSAASYRRASRR